MKMWGMMLWRNLHLCFPRRVAVPKSDDHDHEYSTTTPHFLMITNSSSSTSNLLTPSSSFHSSHSHTQSTPQQPDFAALFASDRFFLSSPGRSNSIVDESRRELVYGGVAVKKLSPDPYSDFRSSMVEMMESRRDVEEMSGQLEFLQQLLQCYLELNPTNTHNFIINAFSDILLSFLFTNSHHHHHHHHH